MTLESNIFYNVT